MSLCNSKSKEEAAVAYWNLCSTLVVQAEDNDRREKNLEEAKKTVIEKDPSLPEPDTVSLSSSHGVR